MSSIIWIVIWLVLLVLEIFSPAFFCLFLSFGALAAFIAAFFGFSLIWQLGLFSFVSLFSILLLRNRFKKTFVGEEGQEGAKKHQLAGEEAIVFEEIFPNKIGSITARGTYWKAVSKEHLPKGTVVKVLNAYNDNNLVLEVEKV